MRTRSIVAREKAAHAARTREIGRLESEIRMRRQKIDELNTNWLTLVEEEAKGKIKARYLGKIVSIQAAIQELEWTALKYYGSISQAEEDLRVLRIAA